MPAAHARIARPAADAAPVSRRGERTEQAEAADLANPDPWGGLWAIKAVEPETGELRVEYAAGYDDAAAIGDHWAQLGFAQIELLSRPVSEISLDRRPDLRPKLEAYAAAVERAERLARAAAGNPSPLPRRMMTKRGI